MDGVALQGAEELAVERDAGVAELGDETAGCFIKGDDDGNLPVIDEFEIFGDGGVLEFERERFISAVEAEAFRFEDAF